MDSISPELALVDEQLDSSARRELPDAPDCLTAPGLGVERSAARRRRPSRRVITGLAFAALAIVLAALALSDDNERQPAVPPTATSDARTETLDVLRWRAVRGAAFYNVIFWRDGSRVLDLWPTKATVRVPSGRLAPGRYQWFVYPAFGKTNENRYGKVLARGTLRV